MSVKTKKGPSCRISVVLVAVVALAIFIIAALTITAILSGPPVV